MSGNLPDKGNGQSNQSRLGLFLGILIVLLGIFFYQSFLPGQILFANDGPLGSMKAEHSHFPEIFTGHWVDLSWIGFESPGASPNITGFVATLLSTEIFLKFFGPLSLALIGFSVWVLFRQLRFNPMVCLLGGLGAALNMHFFSVACWGLGTWNMSVASIFLGLAALCSPNIRYAWARAALGGLAIGMGVMEGFDLGAILSIFAGVFVIFVIWNGEESVSCKVSRSVWMPAAVVACSFFIATHTISNLVDTQIKGVASAGQDDATKQRTWNFATQWSVPKLETVRLFIPGVFGYRLEGYIHDTDHSTEYWGRIGEDPNLLLVDSPDPEKRRAAARAVGLRSDFEAQLTSSDTAVWAPIAELLKNHMWRRHSGSGEYAGIVISVLAFFGLANALRRVNSPYQPGERRAIWFWAAIAVVAILLAWGRHGFLYKFFYQLPYLSTIRGPMKFLCVFHMAWIILAGFGMEALYRRYIKNGPVSSDILISQLQRFWSKATGFDKRWSRGALLVIAASVIGLLILVSSRAELQRYLSSHGFSKEASTGIVTFLYGEVVWYIIYLSMGVGAVLAVMSGTWAGRRANIGWVVLGTLLVVDLGRSDWRWIEYYDFDQRYMTNPVIEFLKDKPHEHRVTAELMPLTRQAMAKDGVLYGLYFDILQNQIPYWNIQSLDVSQMPREQTFDKAYMAAFRPRSEGDVFPCFRLWQLTNTRYVLGSTNNTIPNLRFDAQQGFRPRLFFETVPKPGVKQVTVIEDYTYRENPNGPFAIYELTNALPRVKLYSNWQANTNDQAVLELLASRTFDPEKSVIVTSEAPVPAPTEPGADAGSVEITRYKSKHVWLKADAKTSAVLLYNDRIAPQWRVYVDEKPAELLRCNYIMRGVHLPKGQHAIEFRFEPSVDKLYVSLSAWVAAILIGGFVMVSNRRRPAAQPEPKPETKPAAKKQ